MTQKLRCQGAGLRPPLQDALLTGSQAWTSSVLFPAASTGPMETERNANPRD